MQKQNCLLQLNASNAARVNQPFFCIYMFTSCWAQKEVVCWKHAVGWGMGP